MPQVPSKVAARLSSAIKRFQPIIASAKSRDANESDTVIIVTDMLSESFGYDNIWRVYKVTFAKPIVSELVLEINFSALSPKKSGDIELLYNLSRKGWMKSALGEFHTQQQALSRFFMGALVVSNPVLEVLRRELRRISPDVRIDLEQIKSVLTSEVLRREVVESEKAGEAQKKIARAAGKLLRAKAAKASGGTRDPLAQVEIETESVKTQGES